MNGDHRARRQPAFLAAAFLLLPLLFEFSARGAFAQNAISTGTHSGFRMYYPNSNDWWLDPSQGRFDIRVNGGTPLATLNNLGYLGIGTTAPGSLLDVNGTAQLRGSGGGAGLKVYANGNVGIGASPSGSGGNYHLYIEGANAADTQLALFQYWDADAAHSLAGLYVTGAANQINLRTSYNTGGANLVFGTASQPNAIVIKENGYVGVGTTAPIHALDANGDVNGTRLCIAGSCQSSWGAAGPVSQAETFVASAAVTGGAFSFSGLASNFTYRLIIDVQWASQQALNAVNLQFNGDLGANYRYQETFFADYQGGASGGGSYAATGTGSILLCYVNTIAFAGDICKVQLIVSTNYGNPNQVTVHGTEEYSWGQSVRYAIGTAGGSYSGTANLSTLTIQGGPAALTGKVQIFKEHD